MSSPTSHPLQNEWVLWEQSTAPTQKSYGAGDKEICTFSTVEEFWKYWSFIPRPSEVFFDGQTKKEVEGRTIGGFCLFKNTIKPEWEDPMNSMGSELFCRSVRSLDHADVYWENLVFGLIGETIDEGDEICGCRIVNKTTNSKLSIKIELWLKSRNTEIADRIKVRMLDAITDGEASKQQGQSRGLPEFQFKNHGA